ncbi:glycosyltransferase [Patescibacteria group bacterium]
MTNKVKSRKLPRISVIIPVKPDGKTEAVIRSLKAVDYPSKLIEVVVARGLQPSRQRNRAAGEARGSILYFLDNDSEVSRPAFKRVVAAFKGEKIGSTAPVRHFSLLPLFACQWLEDKFFSGRQSAGKTVAVGGPSIWERKESFWSSISGIIFESFFAYFVMTSRFRPNGSFRYTSEKELVLCNLAVEKRAFLKIKGFKEELYPNEENEFLNRLSQKGFSLVYHPGVFVHRPRRESLIKILKMFFDYGRGRMEHVRVRGLKDSWLFLVPLIFSIYLLSLLFFQAWVLLWPLIIYFGLGFGSALGFALRRKKSYLALILPWFFLLVHLTYAFGLFWGLATDLDQTRKKKRARPIKVLKVKKFNQAWEKVSLG